MDPYKTLNIERGVSLDEVKRTYFYIVKMYHPDKGGNLDEFIKFQNAYQMIVDELSGKKAADFSTEAPRDFHQMRQSSSSSNTQNYNPRKNFNNKQFQEKFTKKDDSDGYVYDIDDSGFKERTKADYERERTMVTSEAENIQRLFNAGRFDRNVFNRVYNMKQKEHKENIQDIDEYKEPEALVGMDLIAYSDVNKSNETSNLSSLKFSDIDVYTKSHKNPGKMNPKMMNRMSAEKDITEVMPLNRREAKERMSSYQNSQFERNSDPLVTDRTEYLRKQYEDELKEKDKRMAERGGFDPRMKGDDGRKDMADRMMELRKQPSHLIRETHGPRPSTSHHVRRPSSSLPLPRQLPPTTAPRISDYDLQQLLAQQQIINDNQEKQRYVMKKIKKKKKRKKKTGELDDLKKTLKLQNKLISSLMKK